MTQHGEHNTFVEVVVGQTPEDMMPVQDIMAAVPPAFYEYFSIEEAAE